MIERYQLRYFLAVVEQGNFTRAAAQCHVSQPTLSVGIAKLEQNVGAALLMRNNRRVQLTQAGARFVPHARRIENEFNLAQQSASGSPQQPILRLGVIKSLPGGMLAKVMHRMQQIDPAAQIELAEGTEREITNYLARGRVECALTLVGRGSDRFLEEPLFEESYALAVPLDHPAAHEDTVKAETLADDVMIVRRHCEALSETSRFFTERGVRPHFAYRSVNDERVLQLVASGLGITVMPASYQWPGVARPKLGGFELQRSIGLVYGPGGEALSASPPPVIEAIRELG